ncbi:PLB1 [Bugula neritina]|uniref:PLB1 n=1 Tax=Bugula neritina TaxID=10212 RepID=A0A7J7K6A1_BUGNE|nr:PLB1 [Bugula neritina]
MSLYAVQRLVSSSRYDTKKDFTVHIPPFLRDTTAPKCRNNTPDATYFAPDCVHWSSKGHNVMGIALWNTMVTLSQ